MYFINNCTLRFLAFCWKLSPFRILTDTEFYILISRCSFSRIYNKSAVKDTILKQFLWFLKYVATDPLKFFFVTGTFHQDTGVGERLGKGVIPLHPQKGVFNYIAQGQTNRITQRCNISKAKFFFIYSWLVMSWFKSLY